MANTYTLITAFTVGAGGSSTIDFTSIPSTYTDLCIQLSARSNNSNFFDYMYTSFNGAGYNSPVRWIQGSGTANPTTGTENTGYSGIICGNTAPSGAFSNNEIYIANYANTSKYKSFQVNGTMERNVDTSYMHLVSGIWQNAAAINRITLKPDTNSFVQYTNAYLYGISNTP
jgi:hypothetical protein